MTNAEQRRLDMKREYEHKMTKAYKNEIIFGEDGYIYLFNGMWINKDGLVKIERPTPAKAA